MRALIVGAGWFGCEIARILEDNEIEFDIVDKTNTFFSGSSSKNQNRLHFGGFHYCRSHSTRNECRVGFDNFIESHPELSEEVESIYIIVKKSTLDFKSYIAIFSHEKSIFEILPLNFTTDRSIILNENMVDGKNIVLVKERWINFIKAKEMFEKKFNHRLLKNYDQSKLSLKDFKYDNIKYTHVFDATYGQLIQMKNSFFEACLTLIYKRKQLTNQKVGITVVDGHFFSLYPYIPSQNLFTLTHVKLTPIFSSSNIEEVDSYVKNFSEEDVHKRRLCIEKDVCELYKSLLDTHEYHGFFISTKTKFKCNGFDDRSNRVIIKDGIMSICGGKITGSCDLKDSVNSYLNLS